MAKVNKKNPAKKVEVEQNTESKNKWRNTAILTGICIYTFFLFSSSINSQFVTWDDPDYITQNPLIRDLSLHGIYNIFTTPVIGMYNPMPFLAYAILYKFWALNPVPYNWFSLFCHLLATVTVFKFIYQLTKRYETSAIVALLFAIHPMHVSVVAWASELKTSLFLIFYFYGLSMYLKYVRDNYKVKYLVYAAILLLLSVLSKPEAVTFAPMLFLLDYYMGRKIDKRMIVEKIPFFVISLCFGILTLLTHKDVGDSIFDVSHNYSFLNNLLVSNYAVAFYIEKLFYPKSLCAIYPYPDANPYLPLKYYLSIPVIPIVLLLVFKSGKFRKEVIFGVMFFVISVSILLRLVPSGFFGMADWYSYLSYTGLFFIIAQFITYVIDGKFSYALKIKNYLLVALCLFVVYCTYKSTKRMQVWENSITLFDDVIKKQPRLTMAYNHRAAAKSFVGDYKGAIEDETIAISIDSNYADAYNNNAVFKDALKDYQDALKDCERAIAINPKYTDAYVNRANIKFHMGELQQALVDYDKTIELDPKMGNVYFNRGLVKVSLMDTVGALKDWEKAYSLGTQQSEQFILAYGGSTVAPM